jgi:hypothetical protein
MVRPGEYTRHLALRLRHRMAILERAKRTSAAAAAASGASLRTNGRSTLEGRGGGSSRAALSRPAQVSTSAMASLAELLGMPNLQVVNRDAHVLKCADEARHRSIKRSPTAKDAAVSG